ncbi:unnamed protein product [Spirodela intermedia]|uniref:Uncharacterized protein n=1 Tax=Spirodela intermedia TaxID=51605 RepID=A0A7I8JBE4_SPIIN|nr:unnamed protein product [Spirodela intermedia]CAA6667045.1 unnamed protein product [Spirodela intermedia]
MGRSPCCKEEVLKKGPWTPEEDRKLVDYIERNGHGSWRALPRHAGLNRCGKSCRLRWTNYLRPDIKRGKFSEEEERLIIHLHSILGNKWSAIATKLPGRTDNEIKNYWNTHLRKQLFRMGIDPVTHRPRADLALLANFPALLATTDVGCSPAAEQIAGLQLVLQGMVQALLASAVSPPPPSNIDLRNLLLKRPECQSSLTSAELLGSGSYLPNIVAADPSIASTGDIQTQSPYSNPTATATTSLASSNSPENVTSELLQDMINPATEAVANSASAGAFQPWRYFSETGGDYCWEDILGCVFFFGTSSYVSPSLSLSPSPTHIPSSFFLYSSS